MWRAILESSFDETILIDHLTPKGLPAYSQQIFSILQANSLHTSRLLDLNLESSYRELFWESPFGRALLERPFKELPWKFIIPWIPQIRLPTDTQKTPNNAPKRLQRGLNLDTSFEDLNLIPHVESSFEEVIWRDHFKRHSMNWFSYLCIIWQRIT